MNADEIISSANKMASLNSEERVALQEKIKVQGEVVRQLKSANDQTDEVKGQVLFKISMCKIKQDAVS